MIAPDGGATKRSSAEMKMKSKKILSSSPPCAVVPMDARRDEDLGFDRCLEARKTQTRAQSAHLRCWPSNNG